MVRERRCRTAWGETPGRQPARPSRIICHTLYDDRGELVEPHGGSKVPLGTLAVRAYLAGLDARPPELRYSHVVLIEKEGLASVIEEARVADRYDVSFAWTKGMSTTACRELVDGLSGRGITTRVLHDFDKAGVSIAWTLCHNDEKGRYTFGNKPLVKDVGIRLADVERLGLDGEDYVIKGKSNPRWLLLRRGVTQREADWLVRGLTPPARPESYAPPTTNPL